jgi:trehalose 6-phosphate synthase/phosphatase
MKLRKTFVPLNINILQNKYNSSKYRFFFLDYEETLQSFVEKESENANADDSKYIMKNNAPSEKLLNILRNLSDNPKNYVYIITGKPTKFLREWFKGVKNLGWGSEYGCYWKDAHDPEQKIKTKFSMDTKWIDYAYSIIKQFELKTEGSRIEIKDSSLCWNFGNSDQYSGNIQASDLAIHLSNLLPNSNHLEVVTGKDYVEIKPKDLNKGFFISFVLRNFVKEGKRPDYIFACGDDVSDEEMFKYLNFVNKQNNIKEENIKIITSTLYKKPSAAQYYVPSPEELLNLLDLLTSSKYN